MTTQVLSHSGLIDFVKNNDFAYVWGAGIMFANDQDEKDFIADRIAADGVMIEIVEDIEEEGCGCSELEGEIKNGCVVYKVWAYNEEPMYIAYYE